MELSRTERILQIGAAIFGVVVAGFVSYLVARTAGVQMGVAIFFLSWTFIALFVLVVRFISRRLLQDVGARRPDTAVVPDPTS